MDYKSFIRDIADFPKPGVMFRDISPLLADARAFEKMIEDFVALFDLSQVDCFAGIESRGFILAAALAQHTKKGFVPLRKAGKLPPPVVTESYALEYGHATLELASGRGRLILLDDVLATGGTLQAGLKLCERAGYQVMDVAVLINLTFLNSMQFKNAAIKSLVNY
jgi:adenine phosphoribosyltransferase